MSVELLVQDNASGKMFDIGTLASEISWSTQLDGYAGKLTFTLAPDENVIINNGSPLSFRKDGVGVFFGYIFNYTKKPTGERRYVAYDQSRYLKNKDVYIIEDITASALFTMICKDFKLKHRVVSASSYNLPPKTLIDRSLYEMIDYGVEQTLINTLTWYTVRDNFGTLEFVSLEALKTNLIISDDSLLNDYEFNRSIDDDTYNTIKLVKDNKATGKRDIYIAQSPDTKVAWGTLQYFEKIDSEANDAQLKQRAETLLKLKNRETKKLRLVCLGDLRVRSGSGVVLSISSLADEGLPVNQYYMVTGCTHNFNNELHTMQLEVQVSV